MKNIDYLMSINRDENNNLKFTFAIYTYWIMVEDKNIEITQDRGNDEYVLYVFKYKNDDDLSNLEKFNIIINHVDMIFEMNSILDEEKNEQQKKIEELKKSLDIEKEEQQKKIEELKKSLIDKYNSDKKDLEDERECE